MYSVMWSEHCSYKSSRIHLRRFPTEAPHVLVGPGEGAGVVDAGDGIALALRIESHNHPSYIEPYQGAATGVGGILRDIFSMGARPIAVMDPLRFGPLDDARSRWVAEGVVSGVSGYGNSVGVPTIGGEVVFDETYLGNPLVNVLALACCPWRTWCWGAPPARATSRCCSAPRRVVTGSAAYRCWRRRVSPTTRPTRRSAPACRWATRSRRSGSSRRASSSTIATSWWGCRTSVARASPARRRRPPPRATRGWTSTSRRSPSASRAWSPSR